MQSAVYHVTKCVCTARCLPLSVTLLPDVPWTDKRGMTVDGHRIFNGGSVRLDGYIFLIYFRFESITDKVTLD